MVQHNLHRRNLHLPQQLQQVLHQTPRLVRPELRGEMGMGRHDRRDAVSNDAEHQGLLVCDLPESSQHVPLLNSGRKRPEGHIDGSVGIAPPRGRLRVRHHAGAAAGAGVALHHVSRVVHRPVRCIRLIEGAGIDQERVEHRGNIIKQRDHQPLSPHRLLQPELGQRGGLSRPLYQPLDFGIVQGEPRGGRHQIRPRHCVPARLTAPLQKPHYHREHPALRGAPPPEVAQHPPYPSFARDARAQRGVLGPAGVTQEAEQAVDGPPGADHLHPGQVAENLPFCGDLLQRRSLHEGHKQARANHA
mmetsp:Transcript_88415/g.236226  ORF Transcript_88415/g.236226 Transcript_88415/m.236226 type:complete len:303 (+) Transcript_88415:868-1776(+)